MKTRPIHLPVICLNASLAVAVAICLLTPPSNAVAAGRNPNPGIAPPNSMPYGHAYGEWGALWWRWVYGIPWEENPVVDTTGEFAANGQSGPVWFLAGTFGADVTRTVTVPAGKGLFFPIVNSSWVTTCITEPRTIEGIRPLVAPQIDAPTELAAEIDGVPVRNLSQYRAESPLFCTSLAIVGIYTPEDLAATCPPGESNPNCTDLPNPDEHFGPEDGFGPAMADGIWLMLAPLKPGLHTIHFSARRSDFAMDVTYHLTAK